MERFLKNDSSAWHIPEPAGLPLATVTNSATVLLPARKVRTTDRLMILVCLLLLSRPLFSADERSTVFPPFCGRPTKFAAARANPQRAMEMAVDDLDLAVDNYQNQALLLDSRHATGLQWAADRRGSAPAQMTDATRAWNDLVSIPNGQVDSWEQYFLKEGRSRLTNALSRLGALRLPAQGIVEQAGLPRDLIVVAFVESGFDPTAISPKGASGPWQFMRATGNEYGLEQGAWRDDRTDFVKSTHAAARYLADLHQFFGDWLLTLASYNTGEERVRDAIVKGKSRDFWLLSRMGLLPQETQRYVPQVLGAARAWRKALNAAGEDASPLSATERSSSERPLVYGVPGAD